MRRVIFALAAVIALVFAVAPTASAEGSGTTQNNYNKLRLGVFENDPYGDPADCSTLAWRDVGVNGDDSPIDTNDRALVANICADEFGQAYTNASLNINRQVESVKNISFDYQTNTVAGPGEIYILAVTTEGNYLYLDPYYCNRPIGGGFWSRADFTGARANCAFYDRYGTRYDADGTQSALQVYAVAHPDDAVSYTVFVFSASATVDRVALGTNRLYNYSNTRAFGCNFNEARC